METKVYACYSKMEEVRNKSSSGGIYYLLAREILCQGGVVFAACYDELNVKHRKIKKENELLESLGSKYMPSDLGDTFTAVKNELFAGSMVLFAGIPCQCGGLLHFLDENRIERTNLVTVDVICHGVPSKKVWEQYCGSLGTSGFQLSHVNMRDKSSGWKNYSWRLLDCDGNVRMQPHADNPYMKGFVSNLYLRPSCSMCRFKGINRSTDITLGDYWGVQDIQPEMDDDKGTSLVFVHTDVGRKMFDAVSGSLVCTSALIDQALKYNPSITKTSNLSEKREEFFQRSASGEDMCKIVEDMTKKPFLMKVKEKMKNIIKKMWSGDNL